MINMMLQNIGKPMMIIMWRIGILSLLMCGMAMTISIKNSSIKFLLVMITGRNIIIKYKSSHLAMIIGRDIKIKYKNSHLAMIIGRNIMINKYIDSLLVMIIGRKIRMNNNKKPEFDQIQIYQNLIQKFHVKVKDVKKII